MKNILFSAFVFSALLGIKAQEAGIYIGDEGKVYVMHSTLLYSKGGLKATDNGQLTSEGNVKLDDKLENAGDGSNILFDYKKGQEDNAYGQLQLSQYDEVNGKVTMMTDVLNFQDTDYPAIAFPFVEATDLVEALESSSLGIKGKIEAKDVNDVWSDELYKNYRFYNYAWYSENDGQKIMNALKSLSHPYLSYTLNLYMDKDKQPFSGINNENFTISGVPFSKETSVPLKPSLVDIDVRIDDAVYYIDTPYAKRAHYYNREISDFVDDVSEESWGHNIYQLGNPYTQNIDLFKLLNQSGLTPKMVKGISITAGMNLGEKDKEGRYKSYTLNYNKMVCTGNTFSVSNCSGKLFSLIRPFGTFDLKLDESFKGVTIKFNDNVKTFSYDHLGIADKATYEEGYQPKTTNRSSRKAPSKAIEELKLSLIEDDNLIKGQVYLSANPWATDAIDKQLDAVAGKSRIKEETTPDLYLLNEKNDLNAAKLSINGFNMHTYRGKPLSIVLNTIPGKSYTLKGSVRIAEKSNLNYTNFFIEDKKEKKITRIGSDFNYSFSASDNDSNRFVAYYANVPVDVDKKQVEKVKSSIDIARNSEEENVIVFKGQTGDAKIYVYNILGQLIFSDEQASTTVNYPLNIIPKGGVYIVKIINNEGQVINKKIIK